MGLYFQAWCPCQQEKSLSEGGRWSLSANSSLGPQGWSVQGGRAGGTSEPLWGWTSVETCLESSNLN